MIGLAAMWCILCMRPAPEGAGFFVLAGAGE